MNSVVLTKEYNCVPLGGGVAVAGNPLQVLCGNTDLVGTVCRSTPVIAASSDLPCWYLGSEVSELVSGNGYFIQLVNSGLTGVYGTYFCTSTAAAPQCPESSLTYIVPSTSATQVAPFTSEPPQNQPCSSYPMYSGSVIVNTYTCSIN